jgi:hypothetical protein
VSQKLSLELTVHFNKLGCNHDYVPERLTVLSHYDSGSGGLLQAEESGPTIPHLCASHPYWTDRQGELCTHSNMRRIYLCSEEGGVGIRKSG